MTLRVALVAGPMYDHLYEVLEPYDVSVDVHADHPTLNARVAEMLASGERLSADSVVVATGAWMPKLARALGVKVPVQAGRGYSFTVDTAEPATHPVYLPAQRIACTPYQGRFRIAGTMEFRGPDEPSDSPCWDSHANEPERLKTALAPAADRALAALLDDLADRGRLDDTLVMCLSEFGRTPKFNGRAGRDHWGHVFSVALAGGGVKGGRVYGASDKSGAHPKDGRVAPQDLTATALHCLGVEPDAEISDALSRPLPASRGQVIRAIL